MTPSPTLDELLKELTELRGSDLHLKVGAPPTFRASGALSVGDHPVLSAMATRALADELMTDEARETLGRVGDVSFAFGRPGLGRFRVNVYHQRGSVNVALRAVGSGSFSFEELGLPRVVEELCRSNEGLIPVTGGAGSGRSTTIAAIIDHINATRRVNIVTIEDPIEVLHNDKLSLVSQREVGLDTKGFREGMKSAQLQDADVVFVNEVPDPETLSAAFRLARTGHLVLTSMHTSNAVETVDRIIEMSLDADMERTHHILATGLRAVISLRLMNRSDGKGRVPAVEVLVNTDRATDSLGGIPGAPSLRDLIIDGAYFGMQSMDQALLKLQQKGLISFQDALACATDPTDFKLAVQAMGLRSA